MTGSLPFSSKVDSHSSWLAVAAPVAASQRSRIARADVAGVTQHEHGRVVDDASKATFKVVGKFLETDAPLVKVTVKSGAVREGVLVPTKAMTEKVDEFTWSPAGHTGFFVRIKHFTRPQGGVSQAAGDYSVKQDKSGYTDPYETLEIRPGTLPAQLEAGRSALAALAGRICLDRSGKNNNTAGSTGTVLGNAMYANFVAGKPNQLVGQVIQSPADLAALAQVYRDPRFETFRVFFTRGGKVVGEAGYTSRLPAIVTLGADITMAIKVD